MKNNKITCDYCERDLTYTKGVTQYYLHVSCHCSQNISDVCIDVLVYPPIQHERDLDFCGFGCLKKWMEKEGK